MPLPVYLICSESGAVDETTKLTSFFNIVEKLRFVAVQPIPGQIQIIQVTPLRLSAYWMREQGDEDANFEAQFVALMPNSLQEMEVARATFQFSEPFRRLNILGVQLAQFSFSPGMMFIEARLRREGAQDWHSRMRYPILLEQGDLLQAPAAGSDPVSPQEQGSA
jgi:hypothetical protein